MEAQVFSQNIEEKQKKEKVTVFCLIQCVAFGIGTYILLLFHINMYFSSGFENINLTQSHPTRI